MKIFALQVLYSFEKRPSTKQLSKYVCTTPGSVGAMETVDARMEGASALGWVGFEWGGEGRSHQDGDIWGTT